MSTDASLFPGSVDGISPTGEFGPVTGFQSLSNAAKALESGTNQAPEDALHQESARALQVLMEKEQVRLRVLLHQLAKDEEPAGVSGSATAEDAPGLAVIVRDLLSRLQHPTLH